MKSFIDKTFPVISIFTIGILSAALSQFHPEARFLIRITFSITMIYLFFGWYLFKAYHPEGHPLLLFIMGYFYSGVFIGSVFAAAKWPLAETVAAGSVFWAVAQAVLILILRKKIPEKGFIQFAIEAGLLLIFTIFLLIRI